MSAVYTIRVGVNAYGVHGQYSHYLAACRVWHFQFCTPPTVSPYCTIYYEIIYIKLTHVFLQNWQEIIFICQCCTCNILFMISYFCFFLLHIWLEIFKYSKTSITRPPLVIKLIYNVKLEDWSMCTYKLYNEVVLISEWSLI